MASFALSTQLPQLRMIRSLTNNFTLPEPRLPPGFSLRKIRPDDLLQWVGLLQQNRDLGLWDEARGREWFFSTAKPMIFDGSFFMLHESRCVATACLLSDPTWPAPTGILGWVAVCPDFRGNRLGFEVSLAVVRAARSHGCRQIHLRTDDWRLPAIKTYLRLGFVPYVADASDVDRWHLVLARIGVAVPESMWVTVPNRAVDETTRR